MPDNLTPDNGKQFLTHPLIKENIAERRLYQETIIASASRKNSLVVLPTGIGKTMIAIGVAAMRLQAFQDSRVLILAPTKPLVDQHKKSFEKVLIASGFQTITGAHTPEERKALWTSAPVIFATPQVVQNDIITDSVDLDSFSLIVFDEAHRTTGDYAYNFIARKYTERAKNPLILGLTASPGGSAEKIGSICGNLFIENVEVRTETDRDVSQYVHEIKINKLEIDLPEDFARIKNRIETAFEKRIDYLRKLNLVYGKRPGKGILLAAQGEIMRKAQETHDPQLYQAISACSAAIKLNYCIELLQTQGLPQLREYVAKIRADTKTKSVQSILADEDFKTAMQILDWAKDHNLEHPKLEALKGLIEEKIGNSDSGSAESSGNPGKKAIIFSQYVSTVEKIIDKIASDKIKPVKFIGQRNGNTQKKQLQTLQNFRDGMYNTLVSTSIGEEGLDIPQVDLIVFYEAVPSEIRNIQRRGRTGRMKAGEVYVLIAKGTMDQAYTWVAKSREKKMRSILQGMKDAGGIVVKADNGVAEKSEGIEISGDEQTKGQLSLGAFAGASEASDVPLPNAAATPKKEQKAVIFTDIRETKLLKELVDMDVEVITKQLEVGDFLISDRVGVERKTVPDFLESIIDGRLFAQLKELSSNFSRPVLVIEGENLYSSRNIHPNAIRGAINSVFIDFRIPIIWTKSAQETAEVIAGLAKREQLTLDRSVQHKGAKHAMTENVEQEVLVSGFPSINIALAKRLLSKFRTIKRIVNASEESLQKVEGIGEEKAKRIKALVERDYVG